jgi:outer membrane protein insertion porin family
VLIALALLLGLCRAAEAQLVKPGPDPFSAGSLHAWQGRAVRSIELKGNNVTKERVIRREIRTEVGKPLDLLLLEADIIRLQNIAVFSDVRVLAEDAGDGGVRLTFALKESPSWVPMLAFTYTEADGLSIGPRLSALNLFGQGIKANGRALFGGTTQYSASLDWPWISGQHNSFSVFAAHRLRNDELRGFDETSDEFTPRLGRYLGEHGRARLAFSYFRMRSDVPGITLTESNDDTLQRIGASLAWDTRDSWRDPRRGWQNELQVWRTGGFLGGDGDFWSMDLDLRRWIPTARTHKLLLAGLVSLQSGRYGEDVPIYLDYRLGGANSVRGYPLETGEQLYGKNQMLGTAEYSITLLPLRRWDFAFLSFRVGAELALFGDVGVVWNEPGELNSRRTRGGFGAGLRLLEPGNEMVRFDAAWSPDGGFEFHLGISSKPTAQRQRLR